MFSLICVWINGWVNSREAGDLRRHRAHNGAIVMSVLKNNVMTSKFHWLSKPVYAFRSASTAIELYLLYPRPSRGLTNPQGNDKIIAAEIQ